MPKVQAFSEEEEEKTTIESGWEEEASTTVEQGDVAEKIRALQVEQTRRPQQTGVTATGANMLDEPTVDDQRANAAISVITPQIQARLLITAGNDKGAELHCTPGKTYTIGRAIDNDVVLTDIAVSRKHFDLRWDAGAWVLVDRGSGNGTLVNNNLEDQPFMLATGDVIEIGNTSFKFEIPNGLPRQPPAPSPRMPQGTPIDDDEEEPSTVAQKPLPADQLITPTPAQAPPPVAFQRPKTLPPPSPPPMARARTASSAPPMGYQQPIPSAAQTIPTLGQGNARQLPGQPAMLADPMAMPLPGTLPTTIPGQGPPMAPSQLPPQYHGGYPQASDVHRQQNPMLVVGNAMPRDATSTALVPPTPYNGMPVLVPQQPYGQPTISRRTKLILAGAGLALFAAIATVAIIKGSSGGTAAGTPAATMEPPPAPPPAPKKTIQPIEQPKPEPKKVVADPPKAEPAKAVAKTEPAKVEQKQPDPPKTIAKTEPVKVEPIKAEPEPVKAEPIKKDPPKKKEIAKKEPAPKKEPPPKKETPRREQKVVARAEPEPAPAKKRAGGGDAGGAKSKAADQFRAKQFSAAASTLRSAAASADPEDASILKTTASAYERFGRAYNMAMAPGAAAKDAFTNARMAKNYDPDGVFTSEVQAKIVETAPRAAVSFIGAKDYVGARTALAIAEASGSGGPTLSSVRSKLESVASDWVKEAQGQLGSDTAAAKQKLQQVKQIVDTKSPSYQKAVKLLATN